MNRADLQRLSNARIREAQILFSAGEYSGAYYLAGYAIECALKACVAKTVKRYDFPDKRLAQDSYIHDLEKLLKLADPDSRLASEAQANPLLNASWNLAKNWTEQSRYEVRTRNQAEAIINAITRRRDGVLPWIKRRW